MYINVRNTKLVSFHEFSFGDSLRKLISYFFVVLK